MNSSDLSVAKVVLSEWLKFELLPFVFDYLHCKVVPVISFCLNEHHDMKAYWGSISIDPSILDFGTRWR